MPTVTVTFTPSNPNQQITCNPDLVHVPFGNAQNVTWNLVGPPGATFATNGIYFKSASPGTLTRNSDTQFSLDDDNTNTTGQEIDYAYGIVLNYQGRVYGDDPEVGNDPRSGLQTVRYHSS